MRRLVTVAALHEVSYASEQAGRYAMLEAIYLDFQRFRLEEGERVTVPNSVSVQDLLDYLAGETRKEAAGG